MTLDIEKLIQETIDTARQELENEGAVAPFFFLSDGEKLIMIKPDFGDEMAKSFTSMAIRKLAIEHKAVAVIFISEVWVASYETEEECAEKNKIYGSIEEHPGRREEVMVSVETEEGYRLGQAIITEENGKKTFGDVVFSKSEDMQGRMTGFLPRKEAMHG